MPQLSYRSNSAAGVPGMAYDNTGQVLSAINQAPQAAQISTVTIDAADNNTNYSLTFFDGAVEVSFLSDGSATTAKIVAGLVAAINGEALLSGLVVAEGADPDVIITARRGGIGFQVALGDNAVDMTLVATQANATADAVPFGRAVVSGGQSAEGSRLARLAAAAALTARVVDLTPAAVNNATYHADVTVESGGVLRTYHAEFLADASATAAEIVDGLVLVLNGLLPAETVLAANVADSLRLTAELAGKDFAYSVGSNAATATWTTAADNKSRATDVNEALLGVAELSHRSEKPTPTTPGSIDGQDAEYPPNGAMNVREDGRTWTRPEAVPATLETPVFVRLAASGALDDLGGFTPTAGTGVARLRAARWHKTNGTLAVVQIAR